MAQSTLRSFASASLVCAALMVALGGCSGSASSSSPPTTSSNQARPAVAIAHLKPGTSASQASGLSKRMVNLGGDIMGTGWNYVSPGIVRVYLAPSETVAEIDLLLRAIRRMPHVESVTVQFG